MVCNIRNYIYIDSEKTHDLYSQLFAEPLQRVITERTNEKQTDDLSGNIGIPIVGIKGSSISGQEAEKTVQRTYSSSDQVILNKIIETVAGRGEQSFKKIIDQYKPIRSTLFCACIGQFRLVDVIINDISSIDKCINFPLVNPPMDSNTVLRLEAGPFKNDSRYYLAYDEEYLEFLKLASSSYSIEMLMSGDKMRTRIRHLTEVFKGSGIFVLTILGGLIWHGGNRFSIKPIAVCM